VDSARMGMAAR